VAVAGVLGLLEDPSAVAFGERRIVVVEIVFQAPEKRVLGLLGRPRAFVFLALLAVVLPLEVDFLLGPSALGGFLGGAIFAGVVFAFLMSNAGGFWDNAKRYIEATKTTIGSSIPIFDSTKTLSMLDRESRTSPFSWIPPQIAGAASSCGGARPSPPGRRMGAAKARGIGLPPRRLRQEPHGDASIQGARQRGLPERRQRNGDAVLVDVARSRICELPCGTRGGR